MRRLYLLSLLILVTAARSSGQFLPVSPEVFKQHPLRVIKGELYDFSAVMNEQQRQKKWVLDFYDRRRIEYKRTGIFQQFSPADTNAWGWEYFHSGTVKQVLEQGVLVDTSPTMMSAFAFVRNLPDFKSLVDEQDVSFWAVPDGNHQYSSLMVRAFDCGRPFDKDRDHFDNLSRITKGGIIKISLIKNLK